MGTIWNAEGDIAEHFGDSIHMATRLGGTVLRKVTDWPGEDWELWSFPDGSQALLRRQPTGEGSAVEEYTP